ncbi:MAG: hypothetical protein BWY06_01691 [Candidatus Latescibacteria bacterium ADurb.Bin168]|nr:MAG: hypothetical protein BWY06_01691 [Candidatus Latescibacteria bacterium ADurb.Bin168]
MPVQVRKRVIGVRVIEVIVPHAAGNHPCAEGIRPFRSPEPVVLFGTSLSGTVFRPRQCEPCTVRGAYQSTRLVRAQTRQHLRAVLAVSHDQSIPINEIPACSDLQVLKGGMSKIEKPLVKNRNEDSLPVQSKCVKRIRADHPVLRQRKSVVERAAAGGPLGREQPVSRQRLFAAQGENRSNTAHERQLHDGGKLLLRCQNTCAVEPARCCADGRYLAHSGKVNGKDRRIIVVGALARAFVHEPDPPGSWVTPFRGRRREYGFRGDNCDYKNLPEAPQRHVGTVNGFGSRSHRHRAVA